MPPTIDEAQNQVDEILKQDPTTDSIAAIADSVASAVGAAVTDTSADTDKTILLVENYLGALSE